MKQTTRNSEKGQVLVLMVCAMVGLLGFAALAIDGGMIYSDRRAAQNAADAAALAGAYAKAHDSTADVTATALTRASNNGFIDGDGLHTVRVSYPPESGVYQGNAQYVQVKISSKVNTSLIQFAYKGQVINQVESVAHFIPPVIAPLYNGNGLVSLAPTGCGAIDLGGSSSTILFEGGIFVNADGIGSGCTGSHDYAITGTNNMEVQTPSITSVGPIDPNFLITSDPDIRIDSYYENARQFPYPPGIEFAQAPDCSGVPDATYDSATKTYSTPDSGPYEGIAKIPQGTLPHNFVGTLNAGVYCIDHSDFSFSGGAKITANGVMFFVTGDNPCEWGWTGNPGHSAQADEAELHLYGPDTEKSPGCKGKACDYKRTIVYVDTKQFLGTIPFAHEINLAGNTGSEIYGTVYAPTCVIKNVGSQNYGITGQLIGYQFQNAGTNTLTISFNDDDAAEGPTSGYISLSK